MFKLKHDLLVLHPCDTTHFYGFILRNSVTIIIIVSRYVRGMAKIIDDPDRHVISLV